MLESSFSITLILFSALAALLNWNRDFAKHKLNIRTCLHLCTYFFSLPIFLFSRPFLLQIVSCRVHSHFIHTKKLSMKCILSYYKSPFSWLFDYYFLPSNWIMHETKYFWLYVFQCQIPILSASFSTVIINFTVLLFNGIVIRYDEDKNRYYPFFIKVTSCQIFNAMTLFWRPRDKSLRYSFSIKITAT